MQAELRFIVLNQPFIVTFLILSSINDTDTCKYHTLNLKKGLLRQV